MTRRREGNENHEEDGEDGEAFRENGENDGRILRENGGRILGPRHNTLFCSFLKSE